MRDRLYRNASKTVEKTLLSCLIYIIVGIMFLGCQSNTPAVNDVPISVKEEPFYYPNNRQNNSDIKMQVIDGSLYIYLPKSDRQTSSIYKYDQNGVSELDGILVTYRFKPRWDDYLIGFCDGYAYIKRHPAAEQEYSFPDEAELICYDLITGASKTLVSTGYASSMDCEFDDHGRLYVSTKEIDLEEEKQYYIIEKDALLQDIGSNPDIHVGKVSNVIQLYNALFPMLSEDQMERVVVSLRELGIERQACTLYPREDGWLIYMGNCTVPLCLISSDGDVFPIMKYDCFGSSGSFNYYEDCAFLSFVRYEKWDDDWGYFLELYENDTISGTYRIDLTDYTLTKISDNVYTGIFVFDNTSIFVCDQKNGVYQLDYEGNLMTTLVKPHK